MKSIFDQIKRFDNNIEFIQGQPFTLNIIPYNTPVASKRDQVSLNLNTCPDSSNKYMQIGSTYEINVKKYMTQSATPTFDFMEKWNNNNPMPLVIMTGKVIKETRGMVYMSLHGQTKVNGLFTHCMSCGKELKNKISMFYGLGPECGGHWYINPFNNEEDLNKELDNIRNKISNIRWEGWIIKSAIKEWKEVNFDLESMGDRV